MADDPELPPDDERRPLRDRLASISDAYGIVLVLCLLLIILPGFTATDRFTLLIFGALAIAAILVALQSSHVPRPMLWIVIVVCIVALGALAVANDKDAVRITAYTAVGILMTITTVAILLRISRHRAVTARTIYGALSVYLLAGLAFSFYYQAMWLHNGDAYHGLPADAGLSYFTYYSFVTLTTLGYGDITPAAESTRTLAVFETLVGQVFLVVVVARLVSLLGRNRDHEEFMRQTIADRFHEHGSTDTDDG